VRDRRRRPARGRPLRAEPGVPVSGRGVSRRQPVAGTRRGDEAVDDRLLSPSYRWEGQSRGPAGRPFLVECALRRGAVCLIEGYTFPHESATDGIARNTIIVQKGGLRRSVFVFQV